MNVLDNEDMDFLFYLCKNSFCMKKWLLGICIIHFVLISFGQQQEVPFTLADRDRIIQTEIRLGALEREVANLRTEMKSEIGGLRNEMGSLRNEMNAKIGALDEKIDYMYWVQGVIIALIIFMLGYMIWDRRTAVTPVRDDVEKLKAENEKMKQVFRFLSDTQPQLRDILKKTGIL